MTWARICHFNEVKDEEGRYRGGMGRVYFSLKFGDGVISKFPQSDVGRSINLCGCVLDGSDVCLMKGMAVYGSLNY